MAINFLKMIGDGTKSMFITNVTKPMYSIDTPNKTDHFSKTLQNETERELYLSIPTLRAPQQPVHFENIVPSQPEVSTNQTHIVNTGITMIEPSLSLNMTNIPIRSTSTSVPYYYNTSSFNDTYGDIGNDTSSMVVLLENMEDYFVSGNSGLDLLINDTFPPNSTDGSGEVFGSLDYEGAANCSRLWNTTECLLNVTGPRLGDWDDLGSNYWALILVLFPFFTLFGNVLVILAVCRERTLQTATNYFIVSLALADMLVAVVVMPFAVYVLVNGTWSLPGVVCDFYIAMDVTCSTSSIFNLVAISIDRYIAVTQPIKYAKHKNNRRVWMTIALVWVISAAIGSPIVLGLNNTPDRLPDLCLFYNSDFIIYSSLSSFYIPCIIMVFLYYNIFKALRKRARRARAARKPHVAEIKPGSVIENRAQTRRLAETALGPCTLVLPSSGMEEERPTNTGSGSQEEEEEVDKDGFDDCHVIPNDKSTEFILATVAEETAMAVSLVSPAPLVDPNGNNDSGYAASNLEETALQSSIPNSPHRRKAPSQHDDKHLHKSLARRNGAAAVVEPVQPPAAPAPQVKRTESAEGETALSGGSKKERKATAGSSRFTIYKVNKASRKKREKSSAKKERKATKTLAIVLGVFLFCWVPFFTCNILDAMCTKLSQDCSPGVTAFILTTWLGYMNSFVNPVIYTIFNPEFRKAFKKLMALGT